MDADRAYVIEHTGWSALGWSEDDPTPEAAMAALAAMRVPEPREDGNDG